MILEETAIKIAEAQQLISDYRDRVSRKRNAQIALFQRAADRIRRPKRGWSPLSDRELRALSREEQQRARKARNKRDQRAKKIPKTPPVTIVPSVLITGDEFAARLHRLQGWLALPNHRPRHLRQRAADIMRAWVLRKEHVQLYGRAPTLAEFASAFTVRFKQPMTRQMAQKRLALLDNLNAADGPFYDA
jgi:hypothetical protein